MKLDLKLEDLIILFLDRNKIIKYMEIYDSTSRSPHRSIFYLHRRFKNSTYHEDEIRWYEKYFEENKHNMQYGLLVLFHDVYGEVKYSCKFKKNSIEVDFKSK